MTLGRCYSMCHKNVSTYLMRTDVVSSMRDRFEITVFRFSIKNELGWTCGTYGERSAYAVWWENMRERNHLEDPGVDGRIILKVRVS